MEKFDINKQNIDKSSHRNESIDVFVIFKDVVIILIGLMISSFGTALFYAAEMGSSPMATFCDGVHTILGISYGMANMMVNLFLLVVLFFLNRRHINVGTVLCVFAIGPFVNFFTSSLVRLDVVNLNVLLRITCTVVGTLLMGIGLGLYVAVNRGFGALEGLVLILCEKKGYAYSKIKIMQDISLVAGGVALSAKWGIGTIIAIFLTGPVLEASMSFFANRLQVAVS